MEADDTATESPLVATVEDGNLFIEGESVETHPYRKSLRSRIAYYPMGTDTNVIESYMDRQDTAYCGANRGTPSFTFRNETGHHAFKVLPAQAWGIAQREPETVREHIEELLSRVKEEEWAWAKTVASLAGRVCREHASELRQLPPRWRTLAHGAIHQGPTVCARGGAPMATAWDRKEAFLRALFEPVPLRDSWMALPAGCRWQRYRGSKAVPRAGLVRATVFVDPAHFAGRLPPLPVRNYGFTVYPCGVVRGVWTLAMLDEALERGGITIETVHEAAVCVAEPIHAWAGERIAQVKDKRLRKLLYTRYWGRLAATGGWNGTVLRPEDAEAGTIHRFPGSMLYWVWDGYNLESHDCSPDYRPDHAAFIASVNHRRMNEVIYDIPKDALIGAHVDAVWIDREEWRPNGEDFAIKGAGELRFYGVGTYRHGSKVAAQGYEGPPLNHERLEEWGGNVRNPSKLRSWIFGESPAATSGAMSDPPLWLRHKDEGAGAEEYIGEWIGNGPKHPTIYDKRWTRKGWVHREPKPSEEPTTKEGAEDEGMNDEEV